MPKVLVTEGHPSAQTSKACASDSNRDSDARRAGPGFDVYLATGRTEGAPDREISEQDMQHQAFTDKEVEQLIVTGQLVDARSLAGLTLYCLQISAQLTDNDLGAVRCRHQRVHDLTPEVDLATPHHPTKASRGCRAIDRSQIGGG